MTENGGRRPGSRMTKNGGRRPGSRMTNNGGRRPGSRMTNNGGRRPGSRMTENGGRWAQVDGAIERGAEAAMARAHESAAGDQEVAA